MRLVFLFRQFLQFLLDGFPGGLHVLDCLLLFDRDGFPFLLRGHARVFQRLTRLLLVVDGLVQFLRSLRHEILQVLVDKVGVDHHVGLFGFKHASVLFGVFERLAFLGHLFLFLDGLVEITQSLLEFFLLVARIQETRDVAHDAESSVLSASGS